jgi:hypothetical protein
MTTGQSTHHPSETPFARSLDPDAELRTVPARWDVSALPPAHAPNGATESAQASPPAPPGVDMAESGGLVSPSSGFELGYLDAPESAGFHPSYGYRCAY